MKFDTTVAPAKNAYDTLREISRESRKGRTAALKAEAATLNTATEEARLAFLQKLRDTEARTEIDKLELAKLKDRYEEAQEITFPEVKDATRANTVLAEEKQFLVKYIDMLGKDSRELKLAAAKTKLMRPELPSSPPPRAICTGSVAESSRTRSLSKPPPARNTPSPGRCRSRLSAPCSACSPASCWPLRSRSRLASSADSRPLSWPP